MPFKSRIRQDIFLSAKDLQRTGLKCRMLFVDADRFFVECDQFLIFMSPRIGSSVIRICKSTDTSLITIIYRRSSDPGHLHNNRFTHNRFIHILVRSFRSQMFHTANVLRRIQRYMPYRSGATIKLTIAQTDIRVPEIVTQAPHAVYIYKGLSRSGNPLNYTRTKNPMAGPYWDETVVAFEGAAMTADLQRYLDRRAK